MARYELASQFREVTRDGATLTTCGGTIGTTGETHTQAHRNPFLARHAHLEYVRSLVATGYVRVDVPPRDDTEVPEDDGARTVLADILQLRGDPRGLLIVMQAGGVDTTQLIEAHAAHWFGELAGFRQDLGITWRLGWLRGVSLGRLFGLRSAMREIPDWHHIPTVLDALFELPIARGLDEVEIHDVPDGHVAAMLSGFATAPRAIQTLVLDCNFDITRLQTLFAMPWPRVHTLGIGIQRDVVNALVVTLQHQRTMPALAKLIVSTQEPTVLAHAITMAQLPLEVVIRSDYDIDPAALRPNIRYERQG